MNYRTSTFRVAPRTWLGTFWVVTAGIALLLLAAVFLTFALIAGAVIAAGVLARAWWLLRKAERGSANQYLTAEYSVEQETAPPEREGARRERR